MSNSFTPNNVTPPPMSFLASLISSMTKDKRVQLIVPFVRKEPVIGGSQVPKLSWQFAAYIFADCMIYGAEMTESLLHCLKLMNE